MPDDRPNIVLINTDQQRFDTINALGATHMDTPHLDRLVEEGVTFTNCHVTAPSCAPSRASLFTGYYPHTTGIYKNGDEWRHSWIEDLSDSGYYCLNVGKMHTAPYGTPMGFDERHVVENKDRYLAPVPGDEPPLPGEKFYWDELDKAMAARGVVRPGREFYRQIDDYETRLGAFEWEAPDDLHPDVFVGDRATWWLDAMPKLEHPLFMEVGFPGPHPPFDPTETWAEEYLDRDLPDPILSEEDLEGQPTPMKRLREHNEQVDHDSVVHQVEAPDDQRHRQRAYYYANVSMIDEKVGEIMDALERNGYDDTIVIFTSDHGEALVDHGHSQKWTMYDVVTRVPTIVWSPDRFDGGRQISELCQLFDLGPTVLEYADVEVPNSMEARSLRPILEEGPEVGEWNGREYVFAEHARDGILQETEFMTMVRSEDWKLVHFVDYDEGMLFDLTEDPDEEENLWNDPAAQEKKQELRNALLRWRIESGHRSGEWAADSR
jgi:arylsulfatase A-like enzyme